MRHAVRFPIDEVSGQEADFDRVGDFLELKAFFSSDSTALTSEVANQAGIGAEEDFADIDEEMWGGAEEIVSGAVTRIEMRRDMLGPSAYPFGLDVRGDILTCRLDEDSVGHAAYVLSLVLSNLQSLSSILQGTRLHPEDHEVRRLRQFFQYFATAALASEIRGSAWSFGFPRPDGSGFLNKLTDIWQVLRDGIVEMQPGAPRHPMDDQVDVFAARMHRDGMPGFPLAAAQVATGQDASDKSLKGHLSAFKHRWFRRQPATEFMAYMIVPFARSDEQLLDDVRIMGNVLHRLRLPRRVVEAAQLVEAGETIEGYDRLADAVRWVAQYRGRAEAA